MDLNDSADEAAFRSELQDWLGSHAPSEEPPEGDLDARHAFLVDWHKRLHAGGWLGLSWPAEYGGRGLGPAFEAIFQEEVARAGAPDPPMLGYIGRPILQFGSDEHKARYLPPMLASEELWCQGFSESGAGSDLAALSTRAVLDGDRFVVNGHKIWTSYGQFAKYCLLLARTDPDAPAHAGISALIVEMDSPGIELEPIVTARGDAEFCEVFYDDVEVPRDNVVGELGQGWTIALTTLAYERGPVDIGYQAKFESLLQRLVVEVQERGRLDDPLARKQLARAAAGVQVLKLHVQRSLTQRMADEAPGPEGSIDKLVMANTEQTLMAAALDLLGTAALDKDGYDWFGDYLYGRAATIYGGTAQIQKNILAQRVLGLPR